MKKFMKASAMVMALILAIGTVSQVEAKVSSKKIYNKFLKKNISSFVAEEGDWETKNSENSKKTSQYLITDLNNDGVAELIGLHPVAYKQDSLYIYTIKAGKVKLVKGNNGESCIDINSNAAGSYEVYGCSEGHLHAVWNGGQMGSENYVYAIGKNGKWKEIAKKSAVTLDGSDVSPIFVVNGKTATEEEYKAIFGECQNNKALAENK